jgi:hypothetical protein
VSGTLDVAGASISMPGDRGERTVTDVPLEAYYAFGEAIRAFQRLNPHVLVRSRGSFDARRGVGTMTVTWWPRGESEQG